MEQTKTKKLLNFFVTRASTDWVLVKREGDYLMMFPHEKLKVGNLESIKKNGFELLGEPTADIVKFIKLKEKNDGL